MTVGAETASPLLTIDFEAALAKLARSQLQGTWQLPAELARLAISSGAESVELEIEPRHLTLTARGARLDRRTVSDFASVLDRELPAADRHRAMVGLEQRGAFALAAVACSRPRSLRLSTGGELGMRLELGDAEELSVVHPSRAGLAAPDFRLTVDGLALDAEKATRWLHRAGRFAAVPIAVGGVRIDRGFRARLIEKRLEIAAPAGRPGGPPLATVLAIPRHGSAPRLWLLRHGILVTHATVPGFPAFEAAVEMAPAGEPSRTGPGLAPNATAAALRERLTPYVETLVDAAVGLTIRLAREAAKLPEEARARVARLLLQAALKRRRLSEVSGVEIFPLVSPSGRRLVSVDVVSRLVRVEGGGALALDAIPPGQDPRRFALLGHGALAISQGERALLGDLLRVVFASPPARARQRRGRLLDLVASWWPPPRVGRGAAVPETELTAAERELLTRLRSAARDDAAPAASFARGRGRAYRDRDGTLRLPRGNATVQECVRAIARDPACLYPAVVALLGGRELPGPEMRRLWLTAIETPGEPR